MIAALLNRAEKRPAETASVDAPRAINDAQAENRNCIAAYPRRREVKVGHAATMNAAIEKARRGERARRRSHRAEAEEAKAEAARTILTAKMDFDSEMETARRRASDAATDSETDSTRKRARRG